MMNDAMLMVGGYERMDRDCQEMVLQLLQDMDNSRYYESIHACNVMARVISVGTKCYADDELDDIRRRYERNWLRGCDDRTLLDRIKHYQINEDDTELLRKSFFKNDEWTKVTLRKSLTPMNLAKYNLYSMLGW